MHAVFCLRAKVNLHGYRIREFVYDPVRDLHIWQGRTLAPDEFNARSHEIMQANAELHPFVLLVGEPAAPAPAAAPTVHYAVPPEVTEELATLRAENKTLRASLFNPRRRPPQRVETP